MLSGPAQASDADWVRVQRFQKQLQLAQQGKIKAMYEVGRMYERGRGTDKNLPDAINWYKKASDAGHHTAMARLGKIYLEGRGAKKDTSLAFKLLSEAARNNTSLAQYQLGVMYDIGIGVTEDRQTALSWYKKAAALGYYQAEQRIKKLEAASPRPASKKKKLEKSPKNHKKPLFADLIKTISQGNWHRGKRPLSYLPSSINHCKQAEEHSLLCISSEQERNTGTEIISYSTEATITQQDNNKFTIEYVNNVTDIENIAQDRPSALESDDEASASSRRNSLIQKGKQEKTHHLDCTLTSATSASCMKNSVQRLTFNAR